MITAFASLAFACCQNGRHQDSCSVEDGDHRDFIIPETMNKSGEALVHRSSRTRWAQDEPTL